MNIKKVRQLKCNEGHYFPLFNLKGCRSSITPYFQGDLKLDHHHYALSPTTEVDLYNSMFGRNIIFDIDGQYFYLNGQTERQQNDFLLYETDLLYQTVTRTNELYQIKTTSFVAVNDNVELHHVTYQNKSMSTQNLRVTTAIPLYGRSADNLRDHRQVTSLLNQSEVVDHGILLKPTLSFDERGHKENHHVYGVFACSPQMKASRYCPNLDDFILGGSLQFPRGVYQNKAIGTKTLGYETIGAIGFENIALKPGESIDLYLAIGIHQNKNDALIEGFKYLNKESFEKALEQVKQFFTEYLLSLQFDFVDEETSKQLSWVVLQPMLRRYFGNSYLPHHDYGRGGRGWRDLWQDLLALIMMNDQSVKGLLHDNFAGVRIDGSNATIIGDGRAQFKADRNQITRVWSDHGAWPLLTAKMYIDETGDLAFLFEKQVYFKDQYIYYTKKTVYHQGENVLTDINGQTYQGTILEHLLCQNLVGFYNTGKHGFVKLEDADWNDGLDMANQQGETVAFTHMYTNNLKILAYFLEHVEKEEIVIFESLEKLLNEKITLTDFFEEVKTFNGRTSKLKRLDVINKLNILAKHKIQFLQQKAFIDGRYLSYYDNNSQSIDYDDHVNLTGQTMALLNEIATQDQAIQIAKKTKESLFDAPFGGYRLNQNYHHVMMNLGRAFGFAYGHKENGAVFSHMVMMYVHGLYQYDLVFEATEGIVTLLKQAQKDESKVWLGIPEYFSAEGIGKYPYLTGSASWLIKTLRNQAYGLSFDLGVLTLKPKLTKEAFIEGKASITTYVFEKRIKVTYYNFKNLNYGQYIIHEIKMNGKKVNNHFIKVDGDIEVYLDEIL
jgi:cellobiose phosphorylase